MSAVSRPPSRKLTCIVLYIRYFKESASDKAVVPVLSEGGGAGLVFAFLHEETKEAVITINISTDRFLKVILFIYLVFNIFSITKYVIFKSKESILTISYQVKKKY